MVFARFVVLLILAVCVPTAFIVHAQDKEEPKLSKEDLKKKRDEEAKKKLDALEAEVAAEKLAKEKLENKGEKKTGTVILQISVPRECKISINNKEVTYEKFEVIMEYAGTAFTTEELVYRGGTMSSIKLKSKE